MVDVDEFANSDDIPLKKGEFCLLRVDEIQAKSFTEIVQRDLRDLRDLPTSYLLEFQMLNFGDGTGFLGSKANPVYRER